MGPDLLSRIGACGALLFGKLAGVAKKTAPGVAPERGWRFLAPQIFNLTLQRFQMRSVAMR